MTSEPSPKKRRIVKESRIDEDDSDILIDDVLCEIIKVVPFREQCQLRRISTQWQRCVHRAVQKVLITSHPWTLGSLLSQFPNITMLALNSRLIWSDEDGIHNLHLLSTRVPLITRLDIDMDTSISPHWGFLKTLKNLREFKVLKNHSKVDDDLWNDIPCTVETLTIRISKVENLAERLSHLQSLKTLIVDCQWDREYGSLKEFTLPFGLKELSLKIGTSTRGWIDLDCLVAWLSNSKLGISLRSLKIWGGLHNFILGEHSGYCFPMIDTLGLFGHGDDIHIPNFDVFPGVTHLITDSWIRTCHPRAFPNLCRVSLDNYDVMSDVHLLWMKMSLNSASFHMRLKTKLPEEQIQMAQNIELLIAIQRNTLKEITFHGQMPWSIFRWDMFNNLPFLEKIILTDRCMFDTLSDFKVPGPLPVVYVDKGHEFDFIKEY